MRSLVKQLLVEAYCRGAVSLTLTQWFIDALRLSGA